MADTFFGLTDKGRVRENNEDALLAQNLSGGLMLAGAIDGVGGYDGGEVAAAIAKEVIGEQVAKARNSIWTKVLCDAFIAANDRIYAEKQQRKDVADMSCVLTVAVVDPAQNKLWYAHVGDTRLYLLRDGSMVKISKDHSFVGFLEDSGRITEEAAMNHPKRNEINKALGFGGDIRLQADYIETGESPFLPGDVLLFCSDGLTDMLGTDDIKAVLQSDESLKQKCSRLIAMANDRGGKDNITAVIVHHPKKRSNTKATKPKPVRPANNITNAPTQEAQPALDAYTPVHPKHKSKSWIKWALIGGGLLLAALLVWWATRVKEAANPLAAAALATGVSLRQQQLQAALNNFTGDTLVLDGSVWGDSIMIAAPLRVQRDSLYLFSPSGFIIAADTAYKGSALSLSKSSKFVVVDGVHFQNVDTAIQSYNNTLALKNVRFLNCAVPLVTFQTFPNGRYVNTAAAGAIYLTDTLSNINLQ